MINHFESSWMNEEVAMLEDTAKKFFKTWIDKDIEWRKNGMMDKEAWLEAGSMGFLCASMPEEYGGAGGDFRAARDIFNGGPHVHVMNTVARLRFAYQSV